MGFILNPPVEASAADFEAYVRLLRQSGVDLGKVPRVPERGGKRRWLYVWKTADEARGFAEELKKRMGSSGWEVAATTVPPSQGPLGPVLIRLARRADGLTFALHPLSEAMIRSAFPAVNGATSMFIDTDKWDAFLASHKDLRDLVRELAPRFTGLNEEQLRVLGFAVIDDLTGETCAFAPPAEAAQVDVGA